MDASSVSTYLDVTQAARGGTPSSGATPSDPEFAARAAKVLAAIHEGTEAINDLPERTGLRPSEVLMLVSWLADSGLVSVDKAEGGMQAHLTPVALQALAA